LLSALLHTAAALDLSDDEVVHPDAARGVLERVGLYVQRLDDEDVERVASELERLLDHAKQAGWPEEARDFVRDFLEHCGFAVEEDGTEPDEKESEA